MLPSVDLMENMLPTCMIVMAGAKIMVIFFGMSHVLIPSFFFFLN
jgi:hypothetical protein